MSKPECRMCGSKPARKMKASKDYKYAVAEPTFCSVRCAADYGLIQVNFNEEYWCPECEEWTTICDHLDTVVGSQ